MNHVVGCGYGYGAGGGFGIDAGLVMARIFVYRRSGVVGVGGGSSCVVVAAFHLLLLTICVGVGVLWGLVYWHMHR